MQIDRREAYATSGPRIQLRFFGGEDIADNACSQPDMVEQGYADGVPMGGNLDRVEKSPRFLVSAAMDSGGPGNEGNRLQRIQIIKGWLDESGASRQKIYDVAGVVEGGASVDTNTCALAKGGFEQLCTVWTDPEFHRDEKAFYYTRVSENPSCR